MRVWIFGDVKSCGLRGEGRRDWVAGLRCGVRMQSTDYIDLD